MESVSFISNSSSEIYIIWKKLDLCIFLLPNSLFEQEINIHFLENPCFMYSLFESLRGDLRKNIHGAGFFGKVYILKLNSRVPRRLYEQKLISHFWFLLTSLRLSVNAQPCFHKENTYDWSFTSQIRWFMPNSFAGFRKQLGFQDSALPAFANSLASRILHCRLSQMKWFSKFYIAVFPAYPFLNRGISHNTRLF